jgi:hypothetical protein
MPSSLTDTPEALDTAIAASLQAHPEKLNRRVRNQGIRTLVALGLSACIALFALAAYLIDDYAAARFCAMSACIVFALDMWSLNETAQAFFKSCGLKTYRLFLRKQTAPGGKVKEGNV